MTPSFVFRSSIVISVLVVGLSLSANAETIEVMGKVATTDGSFTIAQTNGMDRRQGRQDTRQDCRQQAGAVGADKRNCKTGALHPRWLLTLFDSAGPRYIGR